MAGGSWSYHILRKQGGMSAGIRLTFLSSQDLSQWNGAAHIRVDLPTLTNPI